MTSTTNKKKPTKRDNAVALAGKKIREARQKVLQASNTGKTNYSADLENESSPPRNTVAETTGRGPNTRLLRTKANNPSAVRARGGKKVHKGEQLILGREDTTVGTEGLEQIRELQRQLNEERGKFHV